MLGYPRFPLIDEFITYDMKYVDCANRMRGNFCLKKLRVIAPPNVLRVSSSSREGERSEFQRCSACRIRFWRGSI